MKGAKDSTWACALLLAACGGASSRGPPSDAPDKARTTIVPDAARCPDVVGDTRPVVIRRSAGGAKAIGRIRSTRFHRNEESACAWAEDGAAAAARRLGGDLVVVGSRRPREEDDGASCVVEARAYVRGGAEFLRPCAREEIRGVPDPEVQTEALQQARDGG